MHFFGQCKEDFFIIHGGAGPMDPEGNRIIHSTHQLLLAANNVIDERKKSAIEISSYAVEQLETDPTFNAGRGSALQKDGKIRMTASVMDSAKSLFSGVISVSGILHPSKMALALQNSTSRVLTSPGTEQLAEELQLPVEDVLTKKRYQQWLEKSQELKESTDTVGCVVLFKDEMAAATSTGGRGFETPGRVSDSATVAGNYASGFAASCATGIGEQIVDDAVCARIDTRVRDGMSLAEASDRQVQEASSRKHHYAWIAIDKAGYWSVAGTSRSMSFVAMTFSGQVLAASSK